MFTTPGTNASGLKVLSEAYSYPISTILTFCILPTLSDKALILAPAPFALTTVLNFGNFL